MATPDEHFEAIQTQINILEAQYVVIGRTMKRLHEALLDAGIAYVDQHGGSPNMAAAVAPKTRPQ